MQPPPVLENYEQAAHLMARRQHAVRPKGRPVFLATLANKITDMFDLEGITLTLSTHCNPMNGPTLS